MDLPTYLTIGHLTTDILPDGSESPGGTVFFGAITAARLGYRAGVLTAAGGQTWEVFETSQVSAARRRSAILLHALLSAATSTFAHAYVDGRRTQVVHALAAPIRAGDVPAAWRACPIVHIAPVMAECDEALVHTFPAALIGVTPQGWMRRLGAPLPAPMQAAPWQPPAALLERIDLLVLSVEDIAGDVAVAAAYARHCRHVALTDGPRGMTLFVAGEPRHIPAHPAQAVDTNGAGDVLAAAMLCRLAETGDPEGAARFAAVAAALAVSRPGIAGIPTRAEVELAQRPPLRG